MATLNREGDVFLLNLGDDENRFTQAWVQEVSAAFDEVAGPVAQDHRAVPVDMAPDQHTGLASRHRAARFGVDHLDEEMLGVDMQAAGLVNDHHPSCFRAAELATHR